MDKVNDFEELSYIYKKLKENAKTITDDELAYVDKMISTIQKREEKRVLCYFMFDLLNDSGRIRKIFDGCDKELLLFRFRRMTDVIDDIKLNESENFEKIVKIDDWVEGELNLRFWTIEKYLELNIQASFLEFLRLQLRRERFHFLLRILWLYAQLDRFTKDHANLLLLHEQLSQSPRLTIEEKYDLDIITFLDLQAEEDLSDFLKKCKAQETSSDLFTPGKKITDFEFRLFWILM